jgi:transposase
VTVDRVQRIGALYLARWAMRAAAPASTASFSAAAQFAAALNGIDADRQTQAGAPGLHPAAARVLATLDWEWAGLARHQDFPEAPLDNNAAERALRGPVVGRKNYYRSGSEVSAELASAAWTITATAERTGLNPLSYLTAYLDACAQAGSKAPRARS